MSILASKSYYPGDVICVEKPFVKVLKHEWWDRMCSGCCAKNTGLKKCGACKIMKYCSNNCQKNDWPDHKFECPYLRNYTDFTNEDVVHLIGKLILKLKGKDWKSATSKILNLEVSFDDLLSHSDRGFQNSSCDRQNISNTVESFIGKENMPDKDIMLELFGKVIINRFGFYCGKYPYGDVFGNYVDTLSRDNDGSAIFMGVSKIDHSCVPNAVFHITGDSITVRALKDIKKSEKITIAYTHMVSSPDAYLSHEFAKLKFKEKCYCSDCSQIPGESKLTKILDASKAANVLLDTKKALNSFSKYGLTKCPNPETIMTRDYLKDLLKRADEALGRTHLRRMQLLSLLYPLQDQEESKEEVISKEEMRAGYVELTESMREVWGDYYYELLPYYRKIGLLNQDLRNQKVAKAYGYKVWRLESVIYGSCFNFDNGRWEDALSEEEFQYLLRQNSAE